MEHKYRVWDQTKFFRASLGDMLHGYPLTDCSCFGDDLVFQQFTGLIDKAGKEIYEGDIVSVLDENNVFEVKFGKVERNILGWDTATIYPVELNTFYFDKEGKAYFSITHNHLGKHDLEDTLVIGNIFENPELLK